MAPLRVGLNALVLVPGAVGGTEIVTRRLVDALGRTRPEVRFLVFAGQEAAPSLAAEGWPANVRVVRMPVAARLKPARSAAELALLPAAAARHRVDLLHSLGTTAPIVAGRPSVVTVHDLIYEHFPDTFPAAARLGLKAVVGPAARASDRVVAISEATKTDVVEKLGVPADRVDVVPNGFGLRSGGAVSGEADLRSRLGLGDRRVVLCVSAALVHKNLARLIDAFALLDPDTQLVIAGHAGREHDALLDRARAAGVADRVTLTGWIEQPDLEGLYALADCCVYPSLFEGFGLPVLEAMARGKPLACSNTTSLPEVAGDAAELFDPTDVDAIAAAVRRLLTDPARAAELVARGRDRVGRFTWERCAEGVWASYERALSGRRTR